MKDILSSLNQGDKIFISVPKLRKTSITKQHYEQIKKNRIDVSNNRNAFIKTTHQTDSVVIGSLILLENSSEGLLKNKNISLIHEKILFFKYNEPKLLKINNNFKNKTTIIDEKYIQL